MKVKLSAGNQEYRLLKICLVFTLLGAFFFTAITHLYLTTPKIFYMYLILGVDILLNGLMLWGVKEKKFLKISILFILTQLIIDSYALILHETQYLFVASWLIFTFIIVFNIALIKRPALFIMDAIVYVWVIVFMFLPQTGFRNAIEQVGIEPTHAYLVIVTYYTLILAFGSYFIEIKRKNEKQLQEMNRTLNCRVEEKVAEIQKADRAVRQSQEQLAQILHHIPVGVVIIDENLQVLYSNDVHFKLNISKNNVAELPDSILSYNFLLHEFIEDKAAKLLTTKDNLVGKKIEYLSNGDNRRMIRYSFVQVQLPGETGDITRLVLITEDITEEEAFREKMVQTNHLAGMGKMAASLVHEVNNPLTGIKLNLELLEMGVSKPEQASKIFGTLKDGIDRIDRIVKSFLAFARQEKPQKRMINVHSVIENTMNLAVNFKTFHHIHIKTDFAQKIPEIPADPYRLEQVFINFLNNACDAMKEKGGNLIIRTEYEHDHVLVYFIDTGVGIKQEDLSEIFEPFFTTKERGHGTGLGLSTSYGIVQEHGGTIDVKSREGVGTTFVIRLPVQIEKK